MEILISLTNQQHHNFSLYTHQLNASGLVDFRGTTLFPFYQRFISFCRKPNYIRGKVTYRPRRVASYEALQIILQDKTRAILYTGIWQIDSPGSEWLP